MNIIITSKKPVLTQFGRLPMGMTVDVPDNLAQFLIDRGEAQAVETKVAQPEPVAAADKPAGRKKKETK